MKKKGTEEKDKQSPGWNFIQGSKKKEKKEGERKKGLVNRMQFRSNGRFSAAVSGSGNRALRYPRAAISLLITRSFFPPRSEDPPVGSCREAHLARWIDFSDATWGWAGKKDEKTGERKFWRISLFFPASNLSGNVTEKERIRILSSLNSKFPI